MDSDYIHKCVGISEGSLYMTPELVRVFGIHIYYTSHRSSCENTLLLKLVEEFLDG